MKTKKHFLFLPIALLLSTGLYSQKQTVGLKLYPISLIFDNTALQGELMLTPNRSLTVDFSRRNVDVTQGFAGRVFRDAFEEDISGTYQSLQINPAFRMYSKKKEGPRGFYFAPGVQYVDAETDLTISFEEYPDTKIQLSSSLLGATVDLGVQWLIGNRVSIDWNFIGLGAQYGTIEGSITSDILDLADANELADILNEEMESIPLVNITFEADGNTVVTNTQQLVPFVRSRISIGIFF